MPALSIRTMNRTLEELEQIRDQHEAQWYASLSEREKADRSHYCFIERKSKNGRKWIFVRDLAATKKEAADAFRKWYRGRTPRYRLRHLLKY